jgi:transposase-like protein
MEAESRAWKVRCETCGAERSVWEIGGIRWKAVGNPLSLFKCQPCGRARWHHFHKT